LRIQLKGDLIFNNIGSENIWIGVDDTDSKHGGCTTYVALAIIEQLKKENCDMIGYPRLVRLNPNIPWKTRGNGAVSIQFKNGKRKKIRSILENILNKYARVDDKDTNPGFVILDEQPCFSLYEKTVREIVSLKETKQILDSIGAEYKGYKNGRGIIGAAASVAWSPNHDRTYELISYREEKKWGTNRQVDYQSVIKMDETYGSTFDNYDYENNHNRLVPNSSCPILYGIRGENIEDLIKASSIVKSEKIDHKLIFETNQGTDDHLQRKNIIDIEPFQSAIVEGNICKEPYTLKGGHVIFTIRDSKGNIDCAAYEPTKDFRNIIRKLCVGDFVEVYGGVREKPLTVNIEKINVKSLVKKVEKVENPVCPKCGKHMKSKGKNQGFKCKKCGTKSDKPVLEEKKRNLEIGFYEVPVCARRHLSKPLKRMDHKPF
jgi:tRNA(Ile2)-agmatinylcytidine synthase